MDNTGRRNLGDLRNLQSVLKLKPSADAASDADTESVSDDSMEVMNLTNVSEGNICDNMIVEELGELQRENRSPTPSFTQPRPQSSIAVTSYVDNFDESMEEEKISLEVAPLPLDESVAGAVESDGEPAFQRT
ncbi:hypothetical protein MRX96_016554 [Rhipicephalus microplus]